jgi:acyl-CoA hydrolase
LLQLLAVYNGIQRDYLEGPVTIPEAAELINSRDVIIASMLAGSPVGLLEALGKRAMAGEIEGVEAWICGSMGPVTDSWVKQGSAVTVLRSDVQYVVTEYGVANLYGKTLRQRCEELISIAHPDFRAELREQANKIWNFY